MPATEKNLTLKQRALVKAIVGGAKTQRDAARVAGVHEQTAARLVKNDRFKQALERAFETRADKVGRIAAKAAARVEKELDNPDCEPTFAAGTWIGAEKLKAELPPTEHAYTQEETSLAEAFVIAAAIVGARIGARWGYETAERALRGRAPASTEQVDRIMGLTRLRDLVAMARGDVT